MLLNPNTILIAHNYTDDGVSALSKALARELAFDGMTVVFISHRPFFSVPFEENIGSGRLVVTSWGDASRPTGVRHFVHFARLFFKYRPKTVLANFGAVNMSVVGSKIFSIGLARTFAYYRTLSSQIAEDSKISWFKEIRKTIVYRLFCTRIVTHARFVESDFVKSYGTARVEVVPSAVPDRVEASNGAREGNDSIIKVGFLGRLSPSKGLRELVSAVRLLQSRRPNTKIRIHLAGGGVLEEELKDSDLDLITMLGPLQYDRVDGFFRDLDFSIIPSKSDAFPLVALESMMNGTPPLLSVNTGVAEYISEGHNGFLFNPEPESIAECLIKAEDSIDSLQEMRKAARETYLREFTVERYIRDMSRVLFEE